MERKVTLLDLKDDKTREEMKLNLKLYNFDITIEELEKIATREEEDLTTGIQDSYHRDEILLVAVKEIIENDRGTLKLVVFKNGLICLINKNAMPADMKMVYTPYSYQSQEIFYEMKEGMYVTLSKEYWYGDRLLIARLTGCMNREEIKKWIELYEECQKKINSHSGYEEITEYKTLNKEGMITIEDLEDFRDKLDSVIKQIEEAEKQEQIDRREALKNKIIVEDNKITIKALDEHIYEIEAPSNYQWDKEQFIEYVYKHRYHWKDYNKRWVKESTFFYQVIKQVINLRLEYFTISIDNKKKVKVAVKEISKQNGERMQIAYLNDKRINYEEMLDALFDYFVKRKNIEGKEEDKEEIVTIREKREEGLKTMGISGRLRDLEGETTITLGFEKEGVNWYLVLGEKKVLVKGGMEAIKSLKNVLDGSAVACSDRHSTLEFFRRLSRAVGSEEEALEILSRAKDMGIFLGALEK